MNINAFAVNQPILWQPINRVPHEQGHPHAEEIEHTHGIDDHCETCSNRRYQDVSNDPGVSFQAPTRLTPGQAATAVPSHEREHYNRETARANQDGRDILHNSIRIFMDVCPECGVQYVSGGEHRIVTRGSDEDDDKPGQDWLDTEAAPMAWYEAF